MHFSLYEFSIRCTIAILRRRRSCRSEEIPARVERAVSKDQSENNTPRELADECFTHGLERCVL